MDKKTCTVCGNKLEEVNTVAILITTKSVKGDISEATGMFEVCRDCFLPAKDQMEQMVESMKADLWENDPAGEE